MAGRPTHSLGSETLLIVENEAAIRELLQIAMQKTGYTALTAASGREAISVVRSHPRAIDLVITDVVMPDMTGPELVQQLTLVQPRLRTLFMSGYHNDALGDLGVLPDHVNFIQKPFSPKLIAQKVRDILDAAQAGL